MADRINEISIVAIDNTRSEWVASKDTISRTLVDNFRNADYEVSIISELGDLDGLVRDERRNVVLVNAHGEAIPMPDSWGEDWRGYLTRIGTLARDFGWTIVSITGYPFFYYSRGDTVTRIQPVERVDGLGALISVVNGQVRGTFWSPVDLTMEGKGVASEFDAFVPPDKLWVSRCFVWDNPRPTRIFYAAGPFVGAAAIPIGMGFLVYNGMMSVDFGTGPNQYSDELLAKFAFLFAVGTIRRVRRRHGLEYPMEILNRIALDISSELRRLVETTPKREKQVQRQVNNILRLRHDDLNFRWDQFQFPYSSKSYKPDFISERANVAIDVKLCNNNRKVNRIVEEINSDITAYKSRFKYLLFVVYDTNRYIRDPMAFTGDFERHNAGVRVLVV